MADAVAFFALDGPVLEPINDPADSSCYGFSWVVSFFVTRGSGRTPGRAKVRGHVIQRVSVSKLVTRCDGTPDSARSDFAPRYEAFDLTPNPDEGGPETNGDTVIIGFPKDRRTSATIVLEAGYRRNLKGVRITRHFADPSQNVSGANDLLAGVPSDFSPTLTRIVHVVVDCCDTPSWTVHVGAANSFGTYAESFRLSSADEEPTVKKTVDGETG